MTGPDVNVGYSKREQKFTMERRQIDAESAHDRCLLVHACASSPTTGMAGGLCPPERMVNAKPAANKPMNAPLKKAN